MDLIASKAFRILNDKGVDRLYHANSVTTSCQFLRRAALLSRGFCQRSGFPQTPQASDDIDTKQGLWFDVFTNSVDIHERASRANAYGPVLFVLELEKLRTSYTGRIWVTKSNPIAWDQVRIREDRWFSSLEELEHNFVPGTFDQMIVFRHAGGELPIESSLEKIVLDDPDWNFGKEDLNYWSMAYGALKLAMTEGRIAVKIEKRKCAAGCKCATAYGRIPYTKLMFVPQPYP